MPCVDKVLELSNRVVKKEKKKEKERFPLSARFGGM